MLAKIKSANVIGIDARMNEIYVDFIAREDPHSSMVWQQRADEGETYQEVPNPEGGRLQSSGFGHAKTRLSAGASMKTLKVSRTIPDPDDLSDSQSHHVVEAIHYSKLDRGVF